MTPTASDRPLLVRIASNRPGARQFEFAGAYEASDAMTNRFPELLAGPLLRETARFV